MPTPSCLLCRRRRQANAIFIITSQGAVCDFCLKYLNSALLKQQGLLESPGRALAAAMGKLDRPRQRADVLVALAKGIPALAGLSADDLFRSLVEPSSTLSIDADGYTLDSAAIEVLPVDVLQRYLAVPLYIVDGAVVLAVPDHMRAYSIHDELRKRGKYPPVRLVEAPKEFCERILARIGEQR